MGGSPNPNPPQHTLLLTPSKKRRRHEREGDQKERILERRKEIFQNKRRKGREIIRPYYYPHHQGHLTRQQPGVWGAHCATNSFLSGLFLGIFYACPAAGFFYRPSLLSHLHRGLGKGVSQFHSIFYIYFFTIQTTLKIALILFPFFFLSFSNFQRYTGP